METELKSLPTVPEPDDRPLLKPDPNPETTGQSIEELEKLCAAYVRNDVYGTMGVGELPWTEKVLLPIGILILLPLRVISGFLVLVIYYFICRVCTAFRAPERGEEDEQVDYSHLGGWRRKVIVRSGTFLARCMLFIFGFYWIYDVSRDDEAVGGCNPEAKSNDQSEELERPGAIISNHVSYIDILYHMSSSFSSFVAKRSVGKIPFVGLISQCLGCVYVQRESKSPDFKGVSGVIQERVREAHQNEFAPTIMLFPEGTTTNGDYILPFKTGAFLANAPVVPVVLRYPYERFSPAWDTISGWRHVILLLCQFANYIEVKRLPVYYPSEQEKENPKLYAENVRRLMAREGNLTLSDIGLPEKRIYHAALNGNVPNFHEKAD